MLVKRIEKATRTLGAPDKWDPDKDGPVQGLPIRDVTVGNQNWMVSAWEPTQDEILKMASGEPVLLWISGVAHPVVGLVVGTLSNLVKED